MNSLDAFDAMCVHATEWRKVEIVMTYNGDGTHPASPCATTVPQSPSERWSGFLSNSSPRRGRLGMGLAIVRLIVEHMGEALQLKTPMEAVRPPLRLR